MDATFTNTKTDQTMVFIPGPNLEIAYGGTATWSGITMADIDGNARVKEMIADGDITVAVAAETNDDARFTQDDDCGYTDRNSLSVYTVATLPGAGAVYEGAQAFASDGRKIGEGGGAGTGVPVYYSNAAWRVPGTDAAVTS